ncbi:polyprenyl synthetase family protein [Nocardioides sp. Y6]|uniref:Polyprenyl synthetase family protein n=1 Tax=Nocardioides malaquae TaxID=2773426 RepID=A0ABR9RVQ1_9ACTN|nr:polyprenyl synthetase family protein [Nocardioides malaquae]MBE7325247.1 polyprenyl synthetase family protein [Nocardioides malaquae]
MSFSHSCPRGVQDQIDQLVAPRRGLGGLPLDRSMLGIALRLGTEGGKRFRPWLFTATHEQVRATHGRGTAAGHHTLDRVAAALELLHTAFVAHDDVIDHDDTRRGRVSVPGWFKESTTSASETYPRAGGILVGDLALAAAVRGIATCGADVRTTETLLDLLDVALHDSAIGEFADVRFSLGTASATLDDALSVAELKTAAYSFVLPMQAAAVLAGAPTSVVEKVGDVGRSLGIAFQMRDDLLGAFAPADVVGKDPDGDLREGKRTVLVVHASTTPQWRRIEAHLGDPDLTPAQADEVRRALVEAGSVAHVERIIARHVRIARRHAEELGLTADVVDPLIDSWGLDRLGALTAPSRAVTDVSGPAPVTADVA